MAIVAIARPAATVTLPSHASTVVLTIDTSFSMLETDVAPSRIAAAKAAATQFVFALPTDTRVGVVSFSDSASVVLAASSSIEEIASAINGLSAGHGTAMGSGILAALQQIFPGIAIALPPANSPTSGMPAEPQKKSGPVEPPTRSEKSAPAKPGSYSSAAIILLSDGRSTEGPDPLQASRLAGRFGVRIFTVGVGKREGTFHGPTETSALDEPTLKDIAQTTNAEYFYAETATDLTKIYKALRARLVLERRHSEITVFFSAAASFFTLLSGLLSLMWSNRLF
jgi:Ca-activated chloride channel family protein